MQDRRNSIANALELRPFCMKAIGLAYTLVNENIHQQSGSVTRRPVSWMKHDVESLELFLHKYLSVHRNQPASPLRGPVIWAFF